MDSTAIASSGPKTLQLRSWFLGYKRTTRRNQVLEFQGEQILYRKESSQALMAAQKEPSLHINRSPPFIHLPINVPSQSKSSLTPWLDISINTNALIPLFQQLEARAPDGDVVKANDGRPNKRIKREDDLPSGKLGNISHLRVYANCRLRRIWLVSLLCTHWRHS